MIVDTLRKEVSRRILARTRELLHFPDVWLQGESALDIQGAPREPTAHGACRWSLSAALERASWETGGDTRVYHMEDAARAEDELRVLLGLDDLAAWNDEDGRTHADVLALLDQAIAA